MGSGPDEYGADVLLQRAVRLKDRHAAADHDRQDDKADDESLPLVGKQDEGRDDQGPQDADEAGQGPVERDISREHTEGRVHELPPQLLFNEDQGDENRHEDAVVHGEVVDVVDCAVGLALAGDDADGVELVPEGQGCDQALAEIRGKEVETQSLEGGQGQLHEDEVLGPAQEIPEMVDRDDAGVGVISDDQVAEQGQGRLEHFIGACEREQGPLAEDGGHENHDPVDAGRNHEAADRQVFIIIIHPHEQDDDADTGQDEHGPLLVEQKYVRRAAPVREPVVVPEVVVVGVDPHQKRNQAHRQNGRNQVLDGQLGLRRL